MKLKIVSLTISILVLLTYCFLYGWFHHYKHPSDSELTKIFSSEESNFNELVTMFHEDSGDKNNYFWIGREESEWTLHILSDERRSKYLELMDKARIKSIGFEPETRTIRLLVSSGWRSTEDGYENDSKGYAYSPQNLELMPGVGATEFWPHGYRPIGKDWYLYHETRCCGPGE